MKTVKCFRCGSDKWTVVEFRNTKHNKILMGQESVDMICNECGLVIYSVPGRLATQQKISKREEDRVHDTRVD